MADLLGYRVAILATDGFEEAELTEPLEALKESGANVVVISLKAGDIQGFHHMDRSNKIKADVTIQDVRADQFDAVQLPGGALNADALRMVPEVCRFLKEMEDAGKPIAAICHAPWELISAGLVRGRVLTSYHTIQDDIRNAGGRWVDREVVTDDNWVTSRQPSDLPAFNKAMLALFAGTLVGSQSS